MKMKPEFQQAPSRSEAWQSSLFTALVAAAVTLLTVKAFTGISMMPAFLLALFAFLVFFGMTLRLTPRRDD